MLAIDRLDEVSLEICAEWVFAAGCDQCLLASQAL